MKLDHESHADRTQSLNTTVHRAFRTEQPDSSGEVNLRARAVEVSAPATERGFVVLDAKGEFLAWSDNISTAKGRCDEDPLARSVERCSDGALMAWKYRRGRHRP